MTEIYQAFVEWLRGEGYTIEVEDQCPKPVNHAWRGPGRCEPIMFCFQFVGLIPQSAAHSGDGSDRINVWCQYTDKTDMCQGMFDTQATFYLSDPQVFEQVLAYLAFHEGNIHPVYGRELKYQREKRLSGSDAKRRRRGDER